MRSHVQPYGLDRASFLLMVGFRNLVVHGYEKVDPLEVRKIVKSGLTDFLRFVKAIRARL